MRTMTAEIYDLEMEIKRLREENAALYQQKEILMAQQESWEKENAALRELHENDKMCICKHADTINALRASIEKLERVSQAAKDYLLAKADHFNRDNLNTASTVVLTRSELDEALAALEEKEDAS